MKITRLLPLMFAAFNSLAQPVNNLRPGASALMLDTNSVIVAPTNFFHANAARLNAEVVGGGGGGGGSPTGSAGGDLSGAYPNPGVSQVGGVTAANVAAGANLANAATAANAPSALVKRAGDGSAALNGYAITNLNWVSIFKYGASGFGADDSAAFVAAEAAGVTVYLPAWAGPFLTTNITVTHNGFGIVSDGAVLKFSTNFAGNLFTVATNVTDFRLQDVVLDGQMYAFGASSATRAWTFTANTNVIRNVTGNLLRTGVQCSAMQTNSSLVRVTALGFSDAGFRFVGGAGVNPQPPMPPIIFDHCLALNNWIGASVTNDGEYLVASGFLARNNGWAISLAANNTIWSHCELTENGEGIHYEGGNNPAHSLVIGAQMNHCHIALDAVGGNALELADCSAVATGYLFITNSQNLHIHGGNWPLTLILNHGGQGCVVANTGYLGTPPAIINLNGGQLAYSGNENWNDGDSAFLETNVMNLTFTKPLTVAGLTNTAPMTNSSTLLVNGAAGFGGTVTVAGSVTAASYSGGGAGLTSLTAANLSGAGALPDAVLSANVPRLAASQFFTAANSFGTNLYAAQVTCTNGFCVPVATNLAAAISAVTNRVVDMARPVTFVAMSTIGQNINFLYCTNLIADTNYQEALFQIRGDGAHSLWFTNSAGGETITLLGLATNGIVPGASNGLFQLAVSRVKIPGLITNTTYALIAPNN